MSRKLTLIPLTLLFLSLACASSGPAGEAAEVDVQATIDAGITGTQVAESNIDATIDASVDATVVALPTPAPADISQSSEEEVVAEIESAVDQAATSSETVSTTTSTAAADDSITAEEAAEIYEAYVYAYDDLLYAYSLIESYSAVYGELAEETLDLLVALEDDLDELNSALTDIASALEDVNATLESGQELASETIEQLEGAAANAQSYAADAQTQATDWQAAHSADIQIRIDEALAMTPDNIPANRADALESTFVFVDLVRAALEDQVVSAGELQNILQARANAAAGLSAHGGPQLQNLVSGLDQLTVQVAAGQLPAAAGGLQGFEASLPERPSRP